jgi:O-antigen/teichoic acid export membrane protein
LAAVVFEYAIGVLVLRRVLIYDESPPEEGGVLGRFATYCMPLVPYAVCGFAYEFADRWLLQQYGGSVEQAYYAVSAQFASISLIATTSILNILWKEIAEAHHRGDVDRAAVLYQRVSRSLFLVGAAMAGFLLPWAETLLRLVLGDAYAGGAVTLGIMFLYPVHQSMGQIGNTMLYATERVATQVIVGIVFMILSIAVSYTVLAPSDAKVPGFGLASTGLAIKMVAMQFVQVNVIAYIIARIWKWRFDWLYQPVSLLGCLALGWLAHAAVASVATVSWPVTASIAAGGVLYLLLFVAFLYAMPWLAGFRRQELIMDTLNLLRKLPTPWLKHS